MSTALALPPTEHNSPHLQSRDSDPHTHHSASRHYTSTSAARSPGDGSHKRMSSPSSSTRQAAQRNASPLASDEQPGSSQPARDASPHGRNSPTSGGSSTTSKQAPRAPPPKIKTEQPPSPESARPVQASTTVRHRPRKLDLSNNTQVTQGIGSARLTSRDSAPLSAIQDVGLACLSPGFQTHDPTIQQQLARSMDVREQQRHIIEARLNSKNNREGTSGGSKEAGSQATNFAKPPGTSKRRGPPPGLSITAPSASQFASEPRVIQSAPLHQTFTGLRPGQHPLARQAVESHHERQHRANEQQHLTAQSSTRLPPIQDIISQPAESFTRSNSGPSYGPIGNSNNRSPPSNQPARSPGYPPTSQSGPQSSERPQREREYRSAEEAVQGMTGGREELLPKIVHYGGHQPPTPPSPLPPSSSSHHQSYYQHQQHGPPPSASHQQQHNARAAPRQEEQRHHPATGTTARRRNRDSFERDHYSETDVDGRSGEPGSGRGDRKRAAHAAASGPFGYGRDSPEAQRRKKDEFMALCARAWDLFHS